MRFHHFVGEHLITGPHGMAVVIEADGKETTGGIAAIRDAFVTAGGGKLTCLDARMSYRPGDVQHLEFSGHFSGNQGQPFKVEAEAAPGAPLAPLARAMARELVAATPGATSPQPAALRPGDA